jgi:hypothetical protein
MPGRKVHAVPGVAAAIAGWLLVVPCQAAPAQPSPDPVPPPQTVPEDTMPGRSGSSSAPLGDKLDRTDGVIHPPPGVDPEMRLLPPPAGPGSTPVIPPPGTPGSPDPRLDPK